MASVGATAADAEAGSGTVRKPACAGSSGSADGWRAGRGRLLITSEARFLGDRGGSFCVWTV